MIKIKTALMRIAAGLALFIPVFFAFSALGTKFGLWDWKFGFGTLVRGYGPKLMMLTVVVALIALILSALVKPRKGWLVALLALAVPLVGMGYGKNVGKTAQRLPFIHDISTDTQNAPSFTSVIIAQRGDGSNSLEYAGKIEKKSGKLVSVLQVSAYPDIRTLVLEGSPDTVFKTALKTARGMGWTIASQSADTGLIEATAESFWFGFKDDVVIRIRPAKSNGSLLDIRSISRVGGSDLGANAARIRKFRDALGG